MTSGPRWLSLLASALPAVLVLAALAIVLLFVTTLYSVSSEQPATNVTADSVDQRLVNVEARAKEVRDLLGLLLLIGGFYTALQGLLNFYSAQNFSKQAESELSRIKEMLTQVQEKFPMFADIEQRRREAFEELAASLPVDWRENGYLALPVEKRQRIFSLEAFAALDFLSLPARQGDVGRNLYNLGRFYRFKYVSGPSQDPFDLDRAEYYFKLALDKGGVAHKSLNELGLIYLEFRKKEGETDAESERRLDEAHNFFERSRRAFDQQQRARYNLAALAHKRRRYESAISWLDEALDRSVWEDSPDTDMVCHIQYNLACSCSRQAQHLFNKGGNTTRVREASAKACLALEKAADIGATEERTLLLMDTAKGDDPHGGDLWFLLEYSDDTKARVEAAHKRFQQRWLEREAGNTPAVTSFPSRLARVWRAARKAWSS